jgi:hypothetical protein
MDIILIKCVLLMRGTYDLKVIMLIPQLNGNKIILKYIMNLCIMEM